MKKIQILYPKLKFVEIEDKTKQGILDFIYAGEGKIESLFLVCLRYKYEWEDKWNYATEACCPYIHDSLDIIWFSDWYEGQQCVEYLAISIVKDCKQI